MMKHTTTLANLSVLLLAAAPLSGQSHLYTYWGQKWTGGQFGHAVRFVGDVDKDGRADLLVGAPFAGVGSEGRAYLMHGATARGTEIQGSAAGGDESGHAVSGCGDIDGDGYADYMVAAPVFGGGFGTVEVYSGKSGAKLLSIYNPAWRGLGTSLDSCGDIDKDGKPDAILGAPYTSPNGSAIVVSLAPYKVLYEIRGDTGFPRAGAGVAGLGDVDADGYPDVLVAGSTQVRVFSGKTWSLLRSFQAIGGTGLGDIDRDGYADYAVWDANHKVLVVSGKLHTGYKTLTGTAAGTAGDVDRDGIPDILLQTGTGQIQLLSGKDFQVRFVVPGWSFAGGGDFDGDSFVDIVVGDENADSGSGNVTIYSGRKLSLCTDTHTVSLAALGAQALHLDAGAANADKVYWMVGSMSGSLPGFDLPGPVHMPLNWDAYTDIGASMPNAVITYGLGSLDEHGRALAWFKLPRNTPAAAVGVILHHAYVVFDSTSGAFEMASNAVLVDIEN
ncbi:MAG: FG-GAP repeat protein [Planctomycetes bacterium]|nr:FG-GAP repeat protein [Planctomycetota bacterium]